MISFWISYMYGTLFSGSPLQPIAYLLLFPPYVFLDAIGL